MLLAALLAAPLPAVAAEPIAARTSAIEDARQMGRAESAEALERLILTGDSELVSAFESGFRAVSVAASWRNKNQRVPLPRDIEAIIVKYYNDDMVGGMLHSLYGNNGRLYRSRELFELMLAEWRSGKQRPGIYELRDAIFATDLPGIEQPLLDEVRSLNDLKREDARRTIVFIGERKYRPAVPKLIVMLQSAATDDKLAALLNSALLQIGTKDAIDAVIDRALTNTSGPLGPIAVEERKNALHGLADLPADAPLDYRRLAPIWNRELTDDEVRTHILLIKKRHELQGVPDLLHYLERSDGGARGFNMVAYGTLVGFGSVDIWRQTRARIEALYAAGKINEGAHLYAAKDLDAKVGNPGAYAAQQRDIARGAEMQAKISALYPLREKFLPLADSDPAAYLAQALDYTNQRRLIADAYRDLPQSNGLRGDVGAEYLALGDWARFRLGQARRAIELYKFADDVGNVRGILGIADAYQFDLADKEKALETYRRAFDVARKEGASANDDIASLMRWQTRWLQHQIDYLASGKRFGGSIGRDDLEDFAVTQYYGGGGAVAMTSLPELKTFPPAAIGQMDADAVRRVIEKLPSSFSVLQTTSLLVAQMRDADAILRYFSRNDPAGYWSACFFAWNLFAEEQRAATVSSTLAKPDSDAIRASKDARQSDAVLDAARRFNASHTVAVETQADPHLSSPGQTWLYFLDSLKQGNVEGAMNCLTPGLQAKFRPSFSSMSPAQLNAMAESFTGFALTMDIGGMREAIISRSGKDGNRSGSAIFVNSAGNWKIQDM